jgi:hypothetical protein
MEKAQKHLEDIAAAAGQMGLEINSSKAKFMTLSDGHLRIGGEDLENVEAFNYLGSVKTKSGSCEVEIRKRIGMRRKRECRSWTMFSRIETSIGV